MREAGHDSTANLPSNELIGFFEQADPKLAALYDADALVHEGYTIKEHTVMALGEFDKYFGDAELPGGMESGVFRTMLALHDIGKPIGGHNKDAQSEATRSIMENVADKIGLTDAKQRALFLTIPDGDIMGAYLRQRISLDDAVGQIADKAEEAGATPQDFLSLLVLYYQMDAGSYTEDAGGLPSLEFLWEYKDGKKVVHPSGQRLLFAPSGERAFQELESAVVDAYAANGVKDYPVATGKVGGLVVREGVPNTDSIDATLDDWDELPGIRRVPMAEFPGADAKIAFYSASDRQRVRDLADKIKESGEISPLIVVVDKEGPYVLEGGHRLSALHQLGVDEIPAMVVIDRTPGTGVEEDNQDVVVQNTSDSLFSGKYLEKAREGLVRRKVTVHPASGSPYQANRWVRVEDGDGEATEAVGLTFRSPSKTEVEMAKQLLGLPSDSDALSTGEHAAAMVKRTKELQQRYDSPESYELEEKKVRAALGALFVERYPEQAKLYHSRVVEAEGHIVSTNKLDKETGLQPWEAHNIGAYFGFGGAGTEYKGWPGNERDSAVYLHFPIPKQEWLDGLPAEKLWDEVEAIHATTKRGRLPPDLAVRRERVLNAIRKNVYGFTQDELGAIARQNSTIAGWFADTKSFGAQSKRLAIRLAQGQSVEDALEATAQELVMMSPYVYVSPYTSRDPQARVEEWRNNLRGRLEGIDLHVTAIKKQHAMITDYLRKQYGDTIEVYRGVVNKLAADLSPHVDSEIQVSMGHPSSFSRSKSTALGYARSSPVKNKKEYPSGVLLKARVPVESVWVHGDLDAPDDWFSREEEFGVVGLEKVSVVEVV